MAETTTHIVKCSKGHEQTVSIRKGVCIPFVLCKKCGEKIDTLRLCE